MIKRENYIMVQGFMVTDLKLKGNELLTYAIIYGFSQEEGQMFTGSLQYIAEWTNTTKRNVMNCLKSLLEKGIIRKNEKIINGVKFCEYCCVDFRQCGKNFTGGMENFSLGMEKSSPGGMENFSPNNIENNNIENNIKDISKHKYGEYQNVLLTDEEMKKLQAEYPDWQQRIERLSGYMASKGVKYKSHYATIRNWARKDGVRNANAGAVPHPYINDSGNKYSSRYQSL